MGYFYIQAKKDSITFEWKAKEQTRKLAIDSSKPCFEVVDRTDQVSNLDLGQGGTDLV